MVELSGPQMGRLHEAMLSAFDLQVLRDLLSSQLNRRLDQLTPPNADIREATLDVILASQREGWLADLLGAIAAAKPALKPVSVDLLAQASSPQTRDRDYTPARERPDGRLPKLTGAQIQTLAGAIVASFDRASLEQQVVSRLGRQFQSKIRHDTDLDQFAFDVVRQAGYEGRMAELLAVVTAARPDDAELQATVARLRTALERSPSQPPLGRHANTANRTLTAHQLIQLQEALLAAFDQESFRELLLFRLDVDMSKVIANGPPEARVREVIVMALRGNWLDDLLFAASRAHPEARELQDAITEVWSVHEGPGRAEDSFPMRFTPEDRLRLEHAILDAFTVEDLGSRVLGERLHRNIEHISFPGAAVQVVAATVAAAETEGWLPDLLHAIAAERPRRSDTLRLVQEFLAALPPSSGRQLNDADRMLVERVMLDTFPTGERLQQFLFSRLGVRSLNDVTSAGNLRAAVNGTIGVAESYGWIGSLLNALARERSDSLEIQSLASEMPTSPHSREIAPNLPQPPPSKRRWTEALAQFIRGGTD